MLENVLDLLFSIIEKENIIQTEDVEIECLDKIKYIYRPLNKIKNNLQANEIVVNEIMVRRPWMIFFDENNFFIMEFFNYLINEVNILELRPGMRFLSLTEESIKLLLEEIMRSKV